MSCHPQESINSYNIYHYLYNGNIYFRLSTFVSRFCREKAHTPRSFVQVSLKVAPGSPKNRDAQIVRASYSSQPLRGIQTHCSKDRAVPRQHRFPVNITNVES